MCCLTLAQHQTLNAPGDGSAMGEATKGIVQKARMAADLYQQQAAIESRVKERCAAAAPAAAAPPSCAVALRGYPCMSAVHAEAAAPK